ncbi:hypothetical protein CAEBREN_18417 [Caenorhabditis brenneri]|uniref:IBR domain-containing protein n=1 Tax=Caenorhabditis brenneri TaxID=135651 RepID=G0MS66_CAEBE|nr:hypothetical protein CAEBREN_18417 [Caenorhabditis brenneri]
MSECGESNSYVSDREENSFAQDDSIFEKPRGQRRWLGKEHHRGKERLYKSVKDKAFIKKTVNSSDIISEKTADKIQSSSKDEFQIGVVYSMNKKNRWNDATTISLLGGAPENFNAEVIEKDSLEQHNLLHPNKSIFAVHSRERTNGDGEFEVRIAKSSGKGHDYSNFLPKSRELSKKANAKSRATRNEEHEYSEQPTVTYSIYKTHKSQDVVGNDIFKIQLSSKSGRQRDNKKVDMEVYDDEDDFYDEEDDFEEEPRHRASNTLDLTECMVSNDKKQVRQNKRKDKQFNHSRNIFIEKGYTFMESDITFSNYKECFEDQINRLREEKDLKIKDLRPNQYLIDISKRCQLDGFKKDGETTTIMVFTHLKQNTYNVLVNSTIRSHPEKRSGDYLKKHISSSATVLETITRVAGEMFQNRNLIEMITLAGNYYGEKDLTKVLNDSFTWDNTLKNMMNLKWPNQHYHSTWANSEELSQIGGKLEWNDLCEMVKKENRVRTCYSFEDKCGLCSRKKRSHELFFVENETKIKCTDCLKSEFYREFIAQRLPIDLQTDTAEELEYLPTFIPLTLLNLYIRTVAETIYRDLGATGDFEKYNGMNTQNRSCPCGYSWCKDCKKVPHWPMNCKDYTEWEKKWLLRYAMTQAQGSGNVTLVQITCSCARSIFNILLPAGQFVSCPSCKTTLNTKTMYAVYQQSYWPFSPRSRERLRESYQQYKDTDSYPYQAWAEVRTQISQIPAIKSSVMEICVPARDVRFNLKVRNHLVKREQVLIRKTVLEHELVENLYGTSAYLAENVTAWMHMTNHQDRSVKIALENIMETRKQLIELMESENGVAINTCINKMRTDINTVVSTVQKKMDENADRI